MVQWIGIPPALQKTQIWNPGLGRSPEKEMATHSSILAWNIPWTEETSGLHGVARVKHDLVAKSPPPPLGIKIPHAVEQVSLRVTTTEPAGHN